MWPISTNLSPSTTKTPVSLHIGDVKYFAVGRDAHVLGHAAFGEFQIAEHFLGDEVDFGQSAAVFAGKNGVAPIDGKIGVIDAGTAWRVDRIFHRHGLRITKVEPLARFGNDDRRRSVRSKIHVVRIVDGDVFPRLAGQRIDRRDAAVMTTFGVVVDPESF